MTETNTNPISAMPPTKPPIPTGVWLVVAMMVFFTIAFGSLMVWTLFINKPESIKRQGESGLVVLGTAPDFSLLDQRGNKITRADLDGTVWIADFIFTRCAGPCPSMTVNMEAMQEQLKQYPEIADKIRFISFTVDPDWDTPERLLEYSEKFKAESNNWAFLTGSYDDIQKIAREGFKLGVIAADPDNNEPIIHSQSFVLVDGKGQIRGYYDGTNGGEVKSKVFEHAKRLTKELGQ